MDLTGIPIRKMILKEEYGKRLPEKSLMKASSDAHAKRKPRPCGLTIHPSIGCINQCIYCYIQDMGYNFNEITPYGLSGPELAYALLSNPYYMPTINGTYLAFGSITEPFNKKILKKTIEYLKAVEGLGNPTQFSTKEYIDEETARSISRIKIPISPLITIITIHNKEKLELKAPEIDLRFKTIRNLRREGLKPIIFMRPIIPGITDREAEEIIDEGKRAGAIGIVVGNLRVTPKILERMKNLGINEILMMMSKNEHKRRQAYMNMKRVKDEIIEMAREKGMQAFPSSCCANAYTSETTCINLCKNSIRKVPEVKEDEIRKIINTIVMKKVESILIEDQNIKIMMSQNTTNREKNVLKYNLQVILRRRIKII
ncbi:MAG: radical SAM protein [Candidatus Methanomethylicia archaeon]